jgi:PhnB protein
MAPKPIPEGYHTLTPTLAVEDATAAIEFYKQAFGAKERFVMAGPDNTIGHAELEIGDSVIMLGDPMPQSPYKPPNEVGAATSGLHVYVEDVDAVVDQAVKAGATIRMPIEDMFWGDRYGTVSDPFGHVWGIATHKEDVPPEEMAERAKVAMAGMS